MNPAGLDMQGRYQTRPFPDTIATGYGDDMKPARPPRIVPCSTLARWWLALKRWF